MNCELIVNGMHIHNRHYEAECAQGTLALCLVSHVMLYSPYLEISGQSCSSCSGQSKDTARFVPEVDAQILKNGLDS